MGLKSGSRDAGLDESEDEDEQTEEPESKSSDDGQKAEPNPDTTETAPSQPTEETTEQESDSGTKQERPTMDSLPYKIRRNKVNEGREQVPYFLREEIINSESELQETLEDILDETVYKSDYREASMVVAQRNPELVAEILREWGYDLDAT
jgi:hypothetical protein